MIKYKKRIILELERYPETCKECPMFYTMPYECHNERGVEGRCDLGYMDDCDMRDFDGWCLFHLCDIKNNSDVTIGGNKNDSDRKCRNCWLETCDSRDAEPDEFLGKIRHALLFAHRLSQMYPCAKM